MLKSLRKGQHGFTIIEVMIVLAIAALILVVVLVAIPQLQRNQRNSARRDIASRIVAEINNYAANNNGTYPTHNANDNARSFGTLTNRGFANRYLSGVNINDPSTGASILEAGDGMSFAGNIAADAEPGTVNYRTGRVCNGESTVAGNARNFIFQVKLEGGAVYCLDNR